MNTPCPGMKLTLACRLGAEISPNRCDKNLIPWAAMDRVVREQPRGHDVRQVFIIPSLQSGKDMQRVGSRLACPPARPYCLCGVLKFMSYGGLNAKVYGSVLPLHRSSGMNTGGD